MQSAHVTVYTCKQPEEKAQGIYLSLGLQNLLIVEKNLKEKDEGATFSFQQMKLEVCKIRIEFTSNFFLEDFS